MLLSSRVKERTQFLNPKLVFFSLQVSGAKVEVEIKYMLQPK